MSFYDRREYTPLTDDEMMNTNPNESTDWFATVSMGVLFAIAVAAFVWGAGLDLPKLLPW